MATPTSEPKFPPRIESAAAAPYKSLNQKNLVTVSGIEHYIKMIRISMRYISNRFIRIFTFQKRVSTSSMIYKFKRLV